MRYVVEDDFEVELLRNAHGDFHLVALIGAEDDRLFPLQVRYEGFELEVYFRWRPLWSGFAASAFSAM